VSSEARTNACEEEIMLEQNGLVIVLAVDGSPHSDAAVRLATEITWPPETSIRVLTVAPEQLLPTGLSPEAHSIIIETVASIRRSCREAAEGLATHVAERLRADYQTAHQQEITVEVEIFEGRPAEVILERSADKAADLLIIGAKGLSAPSEFRLGRFAVESGDPAGTITRMRR
jgi:nucleotide-binding universal stress UspA family protein